MKYVCLLAFFSSPLLAAITPDLVKESALKHHPTVQAAIERLDAGEFAVVGARGAFDAKIVSDYKRQTKHDHNTTLSRTQLEKPLRFANSKIYAGAEQISNPKGFLAPIYHTGNPTTQTGNYTLLGIKLSLWKNLTTDPDRAALRNAKYNAKIARGEKRLTEWEIARLSQIAYWEWVTAKQINRIYERLLQNGETRNEFLVARSKKGDVANILVTENEQYVANRKGGLQAAKERLLRAEYALALFYRDQEGSPLIPSSDEDYEDYPDDLSRFLSHLDLASDIEGLKRSRPDLLNLSLNVAKFDVDLELAKQDLRPRFDVTSEYFKRTVDNRPQMPLDYLMVMAQVSVPIEWNLGHGNISAARARRTAAEKELLLRQQTYGFEVTALRRSLQLRLEQVSQRKIEFTKAKELVDAEIMKFQTGGGNLFLVNLREETQANAEASFHEARLIFMNTILNYQMLVRTE